MAILTYAEDLEQEGLDNAYIDTDVRQTSFFSTNAATKTKPMEPRKMIDATIRTGLNI